MERILGMPKTPDRRPGSLHEEEILMDLRDPGEDPVIPGAVRYVDGGFKFVDSQGIYDPRVGGEGLSESQHKALRHLIHFIDGPGVGFPSGAYRETLPAGDPFPTSITWWESGLKLKRIFSITIDRSSPGASNVAPTPIVWDLYASDGATVLVTATDMIIYSGVFELTRTRTFS